MIILSRTPSKNRNKPYYASSAEIIQTNGDMLNEIHTAPDKASTFFYTLKKQAISFTGLMIVTIVLLEH